MDRKPEAAQKEEVPVEYATVIPVREQKKEQHRDRKLDAERCCQMKEQTHNQDGCQKGLGIARRETNHHARVAQKK